VAGPLIVDGKKYFVPLATTEGALVASTTRGCKAISSSGGVRTELFEDGMTRAPVLEVPNLATAVRLRNWIQANFDKLVIACNGTSNYAQLRQIRTFFAGRKVFLRFKCTTGDAMGMNMVTKGVEKAIGLIHDAFPEVRSISLSGNLCTDKKPSSINWTEGRGKSVGAECVISQRVLKEVLKTSAKAMAELNYAKNFVGSSLAGSIGGNNAHAANLVAALYLATGQDIAQTVDSSMCMTTMEAINDGEDLYVSVSMPSVEVGTVGGGTGLQGQSACLNLLGVKGPNAQKPGANATQLARIVSATVMAGELSLMAALTQGALTKSHMALNRKNYLTARDYSKNGNGNGNGPTTAPKPPSSIIQEKS
jgi:hydroxymethylglutaryl-CoA reductase (NADPH)